MRCQYCHTTTEYIYRDVNINSILTDADVFDMIAGHAKVPESLRDCEHCHMLTMQIRIAWSGVR